MKNEKLEQILSLVEEYAKENLLDKSWQPGDWINYSGPNFSSMEFREAVSTLLDGWLVFGKKSRLFEETFPSHLGKNFGMLTNSGSSANLLMMQALTSKKSFMKKFHLPAGSKIITPVVCFPTTLNPIIQTGFEPVFVDVDLPSLNLNLDQVEDTLQKDDSIRGIIFAHVLGNPPDMDRLMHLVKKYDLIFLEDSCDAMGSFYDGKKLGSFGLMSSCSFYPAHHMTMGEGGFVATDDPRLRRTLASFRDWGRACYCNEKKPGDVTSGTACGNRFRPWLKSGKDRINYDHRYVFDEIGFNLKPLELQASIGLQQIDKLPEMDAARRRNFDSLNKIFRKYEDYFLLPKKTKKSDPNWFGYLLTVKENSGFSREDFVRHLEKNKIQTRSYFAGNCLYHPAYVEFAEKYNDIKKAFPNAYRATVGSFFLGTFIGVTDKKIKYIEEITDEFFKNL
jgi:CDP-6-deoxy-D-xylo-4-hexulose-3-dehydrase